MRTGYRGTDFPSRTDFGNSAACAACSIACALLLPLDAVFVPAPDLGFATPAATSRASRRLSSASAAASVRGACSSAAKASNGSSGLPPCTKKCRDVELQVCCSLGVRGACSSAAKGRMCPQGCHPAPRKSGDVEAEAGYHTLSVLGTCSSAAKASEGSCGSQACIRTARSANKLHLRCARPPRPLSRACKGRTRVLVLQLEAWTRRGTQQPAVTWSPMTALRSPMNVAVGGGAFSGVLGGRGFDAALRPAWRRGMTDFQLRCQHRAKAAKVRFCDWAGRSKTAWKCHLHPAANSWSSRDHVWTCAGAARSTTDKPAAPARFAASRCRRFQASQCRRTTPPAGGMRRPPPASPARSVAAASRRDTGGAQRARRRAAAETLSATATR